MFESNRPEERSKDKIAVAPPRDTVVPSATEPEVQPPSTVAFTPRLWAVGDADEGVL
jgi:hypothetical protein